MLVVEMAQMNQQPQLSHVAIRNTFLCCDASPSSAARPRSVSQQPPSACDRFALSVHALMYSPKKQLVGMNSKAVVESRSPAEWPLPSEESTSADSDAEDVGSEVSRTTSAARSSGSEVAKAKPHAASVGRGDGEEEEPRSSGSEVPTAKPGVVSEACDDGQEESLAASGENGIEALLKRDGMKTLKKRVPQDDHGNLSSVGSIPHAQGACKPCVFANSERKACQNGLECLFCHLPHAPKKRMRFCKKKRMEIKRNGNASHDQ